MYCVNCGKQVDGTIPICQDCALLVLHNSLDTPLSKKVALEAQDFSITLDSKVASSELKIDNEVEPTAESSPIIYKDEDNDTPLMGIAVTIIMIVTIAVIISIYTGSF